MSSFKHSASVAVALIAATLLAAGCATIIKGSKHKVTINSTPSQANVVIKTTGGIVAYEGTTPVTTEVSKKNEYLVTLTMEGYKEKTVSITKDGIQGWFWGNILCGGIIGIVVDLVTGAINDLAPDQINVQLVTAQIPGQGDQLYAVFFALDSEGQLRHLVVPLQRDEPLEFVHGLIK